MATVTIPSPSSVDHTLSDAFIGYYISDFFYQDYIDPTFQSLAGSLNAEIIRLNPSQGGMRSDDAVRDTYWLPFLQNVAPKSVMYDISMSPPTRPSGLPTNSTNNVAPNGSGMSPDDQAAKLASWISQGIPVKWVSFANEWYLNMFTTDGGAPWYGPGNSSGTDLNGRQCQSWGTVNLRKYQAAVLAHNPSAGLRFEANADTGLSPPDISFIEQAFSPGATLHDGASWPYSDSNFPYLNGATYHPYGRGSTVQGAMNSAFWRNPSDTAEAPDDSDAGPPRTGVVRAFLDAAGHANFTTSMTELAMGPGQAQCTSDWRAGLWDVACTIEACNWAGAWNLDHITFTSMNHGFDVGYITCMAGSATLANVRLYTWKRLAFPFGITYKRQLGHGIGSPTNGSSIVSGSGLTPNHLGTAFNSSVPRIQAACAANAAGTAIALLIGNFDLGTDESVTVNLPSVATGNITGFKLSNTQAPTGTDLPAITPFGSGVSSFTFGSGGAPTMNHAEALLLIIPISGSPTPPVNTVSPAISGTPADGQTLTVSNGTWTGSPSFTYQWQTSSDGVTFTPIPAATANTYSLTDTDFGQRISCVVTGTNVGGSASATSNVVGPVTGAAPANTALPDITSVA